MSSKILHALNSFLQLFDLQYSVSLLLYIDIVHVTIPFQWPFLQVTFFIFHHIVRAVYAVPVCGPPRDALHLHPR
jgi:hypothetical protein